MSILKSNQKNFSHINSWKDPKIYKIIKLLQNVSEQFSNYKSNEKEKEQCINYSSHCFYRILIGARVASLTKIYMNNAILLQKWSNLINRRK